jgi:hypothetical protein
MFNCDETAAYAATSLAFRDRLITQWNRTQQRQTFSDTKRIYYLSLEFLMGRALDNAMLNVGAKAIAKGTTSTPFPFFSNFGSNFVQMVSQILVSALKISLIKSMMLRSETVVLVVWPPASWTQWPP